MSSIEIKGLSKGFRGSKAISELDLYVKAGSLVTLLGPSGSGKTTVLRCIAGLEYPDSGIIRIGDTVVVDSVRKIFTPPEKRGLGMVFQSYALWPHLTVKENIAMPLKLRKMKKEIIDIKVKEVLEMIKLSDLADRLPSQLSAGQQQRVALARSIVYEPRVLLLDEPLSNLDAKLRREMRLEIRNLQKKLGITMLYVTHDQEEAFAISDEVAIMFSGRIVQQGTPTEIHDWPAQSSVANFIGFRNILVGVVDNCNLTKSGTYVVDVTLRNGAKIEAVAKRAFAKGDEIKVAVREEDIEIVEKERVDYGLAEARVIHIEYGGNLLKVGVELGNDIVVGTADPGSQLKAGQRVYVHFSSRPGVVVD